MKKRFPTFFLCIALHGALLFAACGDDADVGADASSASDAGAGERDASAGEHDGGAELDASAEGEDAGSDGACGGFGGGSCAENEYCNYGAQCLAPDPSGVCAQQPENCDAIYAPVCGCDSHTYGNACSAAAAGVSVLHTGECDAPESCESCPGPAPGAPNMLCPDGVHTSGPACVKLPDATCGWTILECPDVGASNCSGDEGPLEKGECWTDADCAGQSCSGAMCCPEGTACLVPDAPGKCE